MSPLLVRRPGARFTLHRSLYGALALTLLASASACGGRWRTITTTDDDSADTGGATGVAGASSGHAGASHAGASNGQAGSDGTGAGSSSTTCNRVTCPAIACADGSQPVTLAGQCCQVCQPVCKQVCQACGPGTRAQVHAGACCPDCVPSTSCAVGQMSYQDVRSTATYKFAFGCSSDADCALVSPANLCESGCSSAAIVKSLVDSFTDYLKSEADQDCAACMQGPVPPCVAPLPAHCYGGQCAFTQP